MRIDVGTVAGTYFINTASLGSYPAFVVARERREPRLGKGLASALAVLEILRTDNPMPATPAKPSGRNAMRSAASSRRSRRQTLPYDDAKPDLETNACSRPIPSRPVPR
jgi:hypothetical protein